MSKVFFIADTHFGEKDVFLTSGEAKDFYSLSAKDLKIKSKWNNVVKSEDTVYVLGDFGEPCFAKNLNGHKILIRGNHDDYYDEPGPKEYEEYFDKVYDLSVLYNDFFILSHEPKYVSENMPYANIFGHVHNNPIYKDVSSRSFCVSACRLDYEPISYEEIVKKMQEVIYER